MSDQVQVAAALRGAAERGERCALVSVVETDGPTYRRPGARMVVGADGRAVGAVSAGCLERDVTARALRALEDGRFDVARYDGRGDDDMAWGEGCGGVVDVLIEPLAPARAAAVASLLEDALGADEAGVLATVFAARGPGAPRLGARLQIGSRFVEREDAEEWGDGRLRALVLDGVWKRAPGANGEAREVAVRNEGDSPARATVARVCLEVVRPAVRLLICGSGPDAEPVARLGAALGWDVTVVDHRPVALSAPERFAGARVIECADARMIADAVRVLPRMAAVVMSHHFTRDTAYVGALTAAGAGYVAVLGPRSRTSRMLAELAASGAPILDGAGAAIRAPAGLDIGGEGAEAIALSIVAEVQAVMHGRNGGALLARATPIHADGVRGPGGPSLRPNAPGATRRG